MISDLVLSRKVKSLYSAGLSVQLILSITVFLVIGKKCFFPCCAIMFFPMLCNYYIHLSGYYIIYTIYTEDLIDKLNSDLVNIIDWLTVNKLQSRTEKNKVHANRIRT
jgi:hypothetical protein